MREKFTDLYNETGIPFQYWCLSILRKINGYQGISEFSFTHPSSLGVQLGKSASIDILALKEPSNGIRAFKGLTVFSIECKRPNPKIKNWVFSRDPSAEMIMLPTYLLKTVKKNKYGMLEHKIIRNGVFPRLGYGNLENLNYCLQSIEFNENLTSINRNLNENIYKSLLQANHALNALFCKFDSVYISIENLEFPEKIDLVLFLPIVVTTADLYIAEYDPEKVDIKNGKIKKENISFNGPKPWLTYEFPLPDYLKHTGEWQYITDPTIITTFEQHKGSLSKKENIMLEAEKITTFVVNSEHWKEFLEKFNFFSIDLKF